MKSWDEIKVHPRNIIHNKVNLANSGANGILESISKFILQLYENSGAYILQVLCIPILSFLFAIFKKIQNSTSDIQCFSDF
jgi:hypothetical protein